jgi:hypothetical protein
MIQLAASVCKEKFSARVSKVLDDRKKKFDYKRKLTLSVRDEFKSKIGNT